MNTLKKAVAVVGVMAFSVSALLLGGASAQAKSYNFVYTGHVQNIGWQKMVGDGEIAGTVGKGLALEAINFVYPGMQARGHVQDIGWQAWQANDATQVGTTGKSKRLEAVQVKSTVQGVKIECQAHVQDKGWLPWTADGGVCGTTGQGKRLEAVRFRLVQK